MQNVSLISKNTSAYTRPPLSEEDERAASNLRRIWKAYKARHRINQEEFAGRLNWTQGNFSQYLTGKVPLGQKAMLKLCAALGCDPGDIREELRSHMMEMRHELLAAQLVSVLEALKNLADAGLNDIIDSCEKALDADAMASCARGESAE